MRRQAVARVARLGLVVLAACSKGGDRKPLGEAIVGEWQTVCRTDQEATTSCLGDERDPLVHAFAPGGTFVLSGGPGAPMQGTWTVAGDRVEVTFVGGGMTLREVSRARIVDGQLVMWMADLGFGSILRRRGAPATVASSGAASDGSPIARELGGVRYTLALPAGYRLARDDNRRQRWEPVAGDGLRFAITVAPRARSGRPDGTFATPPCGDEPPFESSTGGKLVGGVERDTSIGVGVCVAGSALSIQCDAEHSRGYLEPADREPARAVCRSLRVTR